MYGILVAEILWISQNTAVHVLGFNKSHRWRTFKHSNQKAIPKTRALYAELS